MSDDTERGTPNAQGLTVFDNLIQGGLPQLVAGPAGKAISRLIAEAVEIPAAWLQQKKQAITDETDGRSLIRRALFEKAALDVPGHDSVVERAIIRAIDGQVRKQNNREAIAVEVLKSIAEDPLSSEAASPSDDWMNFYSSHAENASSDKLRETWSRILSGEIRKPGSFSLRTLQFISVLDSTTAQDFEAVAQWVLDGQLLLIPNKGIEKGVYERVLRLKEAGLVGEKVTSTRPYINGLAQITLADHLILFHSPSGHLTFDSDSLTGTGQEIYHILSKKSKYQDAKEIVFRTLSNSGSQQATIYRRAINRDWLDEDDIVSVATLKTDQHGEFASINFVDKDNRQRQNE